MTCWPPLYAVAEFHAATPAQLPLPLVGELPALVDVLLGPEGASPAQALTRSPRGCVRQTRRGANGCKPASVYVLGCQSPLGSALGAPDAYHFAWRRSRRRLTIDLGAQEKRSTHLPDVPKDRCRKSVGEGSRRGGRMTAKPTLGTTLCFRRDRSRSLSMRAPSMRDR